LEIDDAIVILADRRDALAGLRVENRQVIARRDDDDSLVIAIGPVGESASGELARRLLPADAFIHRPLPERVARLRIERERLAACRRDGEEATPCVQWRRSVVLVVAIVLAAFPTPLHLERIEVRGVDLVGGGIARTPCIGAPVAPLERRVATNERRLLRRT